MSLVVFATVALTACSNDSGVDAESADRVQTVPGTEDTTPATDESNPPETDPAETVPPTSGPRPTLPGTLPPQTNPEDTEPEDTEPEDTDPDDTTPIESPDGVGDPLFPDLGNPGIDVEHYDIAIAYDPDDDSIEGAVTLSLVPTEPRAEFTLDSAGPEVSSVTVDGEDASFEQEDVELRIRPATPLDQDKAVDVVVEYTATPDAGDSSSGLPNGWFHTDGGSYVLNEPDGARTWLPSNDHPIDKATYTFRITVPTGLTAVANGALVSTTSGPEGDEWVWEESVPMTTYLIQLLTGDYEIIEGEGPNGLPLSSVVLREDRELMQPYLDTIDDQIDFFDDFFGPYPLAQYGIAMTDSVGGLAMETQSRSLFSREDFLSGELGFIEELLLSHELSHMWFGDAVSPAEWQDIWLNESFASYAQWMWLDHVGIATLESQADDALATKEMFGEGATATPDADELFGFNSYDGGAVILHALRLTVGDDVFFELLRTWVADNLGQSRHTEDFVELASKVAGTDLTDFFDEWLFAEVAPTEFPEPAG
jgi:aminopeptidase N